MARALTNEQVDQLWTAFRESGGSVRATAESTGRSRSCVAKYATKGDPRRGIKPFKERLRKVRQVAQEKADYTLAKSLAETLKITRPIKLRLAQRIAEALEKGTTKTKVTRDAEGNITGREDVHEPYAASIRDLEALVRLERLCLGSPDEVIADQIRATVGVVFALLRSMGFGDQQIIELASKLDALAPSAIAKSGKAKRARPEHLRPVQS